MRRQLSLLVAAVAAAVVVAFVLPLALLVRTLAEDRAMSAATQEAHSVAVVAAVEPNADQLRPVIALVNQRSTRRTTVFFPDGRTEGTPATRTASVDSAFHGSSFVTAVGEDRLLLVPVSTSAGTIVVQTRVPEALLRRGVATSWAILATLGLGVLCFSVLAADRIGRRIVRPILDLADAAHRLTEGDLEARVDPAGTAGGPPARGDVQPGCPPCDRAAAGRARAGRGPVPPPAYPDHGAAPRRRDARGSG